MPLRNKSKKEMKFSLKPWISSGLKHSVNERKRLYRLSRITHLNQSARKTKYNRYKNKLEKMLFEAQCKFYSDKIIQCQNLSMALWRIINVITQRKKKTYAALRRLKFENGMILENSKEIADALNKYFVHVGPKLA